MVMGVFGSTALARFQTPPVEVDLLKAFMLASPFLEAVKGNRLPAWAVSCQRSRRPLWSVRGELTAAKLLVYASACLLMTAIEMDLPRQACCVRHSWRKSRSS